MFTFFFLVQRRGLITFCGQDVQVLFDVNGDDAKTTFRKFDDGVYTNKVIVSKHPNIVKSVIEGKKGWGLWRKQWSQGIGEGVFFKWEILEEFKKRNIEIPESFMKEFEDSIWKERFKYNVIIFKKENEPCK